MTNDNKQQKHSDSTDTAIAYSECYAQVFLGDCLEQHEHIKSGSVDLILVKFHHVIVLFFVFINAYDGVTGLLNWK